MVGSSVGLGIYNVGMQHLIMSESKEIKNNYSHRGISKQHRNELKDLLVSQIQNNFGKNNVVLDYNPNYKISIHESIIEMND